MGMSFHPSVNFLFFGCWNREILINNDSSSSASTALVHPRDKVLKAIRDNEGHLTKYDCCIIAGDNVYPSPSSNKKEKKSDGKDHVKAKKTYPPSLVENGFKLLADSVRHVEGQEGHKIDMHMILGNHNTDLLDKEIECAVKNNIILHARKHGSAYGKHSFKDYGEVRFLFIDTNFNLVDTQLNQQTGTQNILNLTAFLRENLRTDSWWNIIVGHEPLVSVKTKPDNSMKTGNLLGAGMLVDLLAEHHNVIYFCADVHMFQAGQVFNNNARVPMIVSGTGGADPDDLYGQSSTSIITKDKLMYTLIDHAASYGYCSVTVTATQVYVTYIPIDKGPRHIIWIQRAGMKKAREI